jgi:hypothetical protein
MPSGKKALTRGGAVMKRVALFVMAAALMTGVSSAQQEAATDQAKGADELVRVKGRFEENWIRPGADITQYGKLNLPQAEYQYRDVGEARRGQSTASMMRRGDQPFAMSEESRQRFEQVVSETFAKELGRSKVFEVVDVEGPGTLVVRGHLTDIVWYVPPDFTGSGEIYVSAAGEADLVFEVIDSKTGMVQARFEGRSRIQPQDRLYEVGSVPAYSNTVFSEVERWARTVARNMRRALEKAHKNGLK